MRYKPGSFSKNFGWHGTGLRKLHQSIRDGFGGELRPVDRRTFRSQSGLDDSLSLLPINFYLYNRSGMLMVDELVWQALGRAHTPRFDRLALFAFHLSQVGPGSDHVERPAMWANEFVRERLWSADAWRAPALNDSSLDLFLRDRMDAKVEVRTKCRNNYRHLFYLCGYWPPRHDLINTEPDDWATSAMKLLWDRIGEAGASGSEDHLVDLAMAQDVHKLLGISERQAFGFARHAAADYVGAGGARRFEGQPADDPEPRVPTRRVPRPNAPGPSESGGDLDWLDQQSTDEAVERRIVERQEQKRDRNKAAKLKTLYENRCLFCGIQVQVDAGRYYSEAAHIRALGEPHNGPDSTENLIVLCPNHHIQFDRGVLRIRKVGSTYRVSSKFGEDVLHDRPVELLHPVGENFIRYHYDWHADEAPTPDEQA